MVVNCMHVMIFVQRKKPVRRVSFLHFYRIESEIARSFVRKINVKEKILRVPFDWTVKLFWHLNSVMASFFYTNRANDPLKMLIFVKKIGQSRQPVSIMFLSTKRYKILKALMDAPMIHYLVNLIAVQGEAGSWHINSICLCTFKFSSRFGKSYK